MGENNRVFTILNYTTGRIIPDLSSVEVCIVARVLMHIGFPSFDIVSDTYMGKRFCTQDFHEEQDKTWKYSPEGPINRAAEDRN